MIREREDGLRVPREKISRRATCQELHPGLCVSRDRDVYHQVLEASKHLISQLSKASPGSFFKLTAHSVLDEEVCKLHVCFATLRLRNPALVIFCECMAFIDEDAEEQRVRLVTEDKGKGDEPVFVTSYALLVRLVRASLQTLGGYVSLAKLKEHNESGLAAIVLGEEDAAIIWLSTIEPYEVETHHVEDRDAENLLDVIGCAAPRVGVRRAFSGSDGLRDRAM